ncbi:MAG: HAD hydrolase-like protein, partial [Thioalkalispiraceae bacterium]
KKPDPAIYQYALTNMHTHQDHSLFVGDGGSDEFLGADQSGIITVHTTQFSRPHRTAKVREQQANAIHHEVEHLRGVLELLG